MEILKFGSNLAWFWTLLGFIFPITLALVLTAPWVANTSWYQNKSVQVTGKALSFPTYTKVQSFLLIVVIIAMFLYFGYTLLQFHSLRVNAQKQVTVKNQFGITVGKFSLNEITKVEVLEVVSRGRRLQYLLLTTRNHAYRSLSGPSTQIQDSRDKLERLRIQ